MDIAAFTKRMLDQFDKIRGMHMKLFIFQLIFRQSLTYCNFKDYYIFYLKDSTLYRVRKSY